MEHDRYKEWLYLSVFDELDGDKKDTLEAHVRSCDRCRREREELVRLLESVTASNAGRPSDEALVSARHRLNAALQREPRLGRVPGAVVPREPALSRWFGAGRKTRERSFTGGWLRGYRVLLAGAATLCVGFFAGYLTFGGASESSPIQATIPDVIDSYTRISNVQFLDADGGSGEIELQYDQVRPMRLRADIDDRRMRRLLAHAILTGDNPGVRLKAINAFETAQSPTPTEDVRRVLIGALISDPNAGVRREAFLVLQRLPYDDDVKEALMYVLAYDDNPGLRIAAMNRLTAFVVDGDITEKEYHDILDTR